MDFNHEDSEFRFPPDWGAPILSWARPRFEAAFIFLHPFFRVPDELYMYVVKDGSRWLEPGGYEKLMQSPVDHVKWSSIMRDESVPNMLIKS
jgi:hypothetical protein